MKSEAKLFGGILAISLVLVGFAVYPTIMHMREAPPPDKPVDPKKQITQDVLLPPESHTLGDPKAPFTLVEFGDYQCVSCKVALTEIKRIYDKNKHRLKIVFHHHQANAGHVNSPIMAQGAWAAGNQGKFWQMHDKLYEAQDRFKNLTMTEAMDDVMKIAKELRLDMLKFDPEFRSDKSVNAVDAVEDLADKCEVETTPTFFFISSTGKVTQLPRLTVMVGFMEDEKNWK